VPARTTESLRVVVEPVVAAAGFDLEDLTVTPAGRRRLLRVTVDADGGVDLDAVAEIARVVSAALDEVDVLGAVPYVLEVGSPGVERPLTEPRHWRRAVGRLVAVTPVAGPAGSGAAVTGRVLRAEEAAAVLDVDGVERVVAYTAVAHAQVQVEFRRPGSDPGVELDEVEGDDPDSDDPDGEPDGDDPDGNDPDGEPDGDGPDGEPHGADPDGAAPGGSPPG